MRRLTFIPNWRSEILRLWSIRVGLFWSAITVFVTVGALVSDKLQEAIGWKTFALLMAAALGSLLTARLLKQPGADAEVP